MFNRSGVLQTRGENSGERCLFVAKDANGLCALQIALSFFRERV